VICPAQSMPVPAAALLICLTLCHLLPACHVVTTVLLQTVMNTDFLYSKLCPTPVWPRQRLLFSQTLHRPSTHCLLHNISFASSFVIATLLGAAYLLGSLHKTARRPSHLLQTVLEHRTHHSSPHLPYWAQLPILQMKRLYPKLLGPL